MTVVTGPPSTRDAILGAAETTFGQLGFRGTAMAAVAEQAGVSRPLVHRYFGDKETLYREVVDRLLRQWNQALLDAAVRTAPSTAHVLRAVMSECVTWARQREMLRGVLLRDADVTRLIARETLEEGRDRLPALLERVLAEGVERGDIRADLDAAETAAVLAGVIISGAVQALTTTSEDAYRRRVETMIEIVLHGVVVVVGR